MSTSPSYDLEIFTWPWPCFVGDLHFSAGGRAGFVRGPVRHLPAVRSPLPARATRLQEGRTGRGGWVSNRYGRTNATCEQGSIPVGCVPLAFLVPAGGSAQLCPLPMQTLAPDVDLHPLDAVPPGADPPTPVHVTWNACWEANTPSPDTGHVSCDACWEAPPHLVDRQTPVKTLPCPKLCFRAVTSL